MEDSEGERNLLTALITVQHAGAYPKVSGLSRNEIYACLWYCPL